MSTTTRTRDPDETRERLLTAAFEEIFRTGYQAASLKNILEDTGVTKGALYHHFPDKAALGLAVLEEVVRRPLLDAYLNPLEEQGEDPLSTLQAVLRGRADDFDGDEGVMLGCPLNNLAQEMSPLDEDFRRAAKGILDEWIDGFARVLDEARKQRVVRDDVDPRQMATFLVAAVEGSFGLAKNARSVDVLRTNLDTLAAFLDTLRVAPG